MRQVSEDRPQRSQGGLRRMPFSPPRGAKDSDREGYHDQVAVRATAVPFSMPILPQHEPEVDDIVHQRSSDDPLDPVFGGFPSSPLTYVDRHLPIWSTASYDTDSHGNVDRANENAAAPSYLSFLDPPSLGAASDLLSLVADYFAGPAQHIFNSSVLDPRWLASSSLRYISLSTGLAYLVPAICGSSPG